MQFNQAVVLKLRRSALLAVSLMIVGQVHCLAADDKATKAEDPAFKSAVELYGKASYAEAQTEFEKLVGSKENGDVSRYYKALCLQKQRQYKAAKDEYMYLYYKAQDKTVRYKAWQALKTLPGAQATATSTPKTSSQGGTAVARKDGPGADAWINPENAISNYGRSGPEATSSVSVTVIPTTCGRRRR